MLSNKITNGTSWLLIFRPYIETKMFFIYENREVIGSLVGCISNYNELLKTTKIPTTLSKQWVLGRYFQKPSNIEKVIVTDTKYHTILASKKNWLWSYKIQVTAKQQFGLSTEQLFILATSDIAIKAPILHATWTLKDNLKSPKTN